ncbi:MAG: hypothetical protein K2L95_04685 [Alphaproteobacteria bacterium]|nr:hypothetical protein [Alphaproteobacteria bacterium]
MKQIIVLMLPWALAACGTMGIGSNHKTTVFNNSGDVVFATGEMGRIKIQPETSTEIHTGERFELSSKNPDCDTLVVDGRLNTAAVFLDIIPGGLLGVLPIFVDAMTKNMYKMPHEYIYECQ